LADR